LVLVAGTIGWLLARAGQRATPANVAVRTATASVVITDLATTTQVGGTLGYSGSYVVLAQGAGGTITAVPAPGEVIARGHGAFEVDGHPVSLFYGARPGWRTLASGVSDGPDVAQLEQNLTSLGYAVASSLTVDEHFTSATSAAIKRWQRATGQRVTGQVQLGAVVYAPGPIRVASVQASLGQLVHAGEPLLTATSTTAVVSVPVPASQSYLIHVADAVTVTLPSGNLTPGTVEAISTAANLPTSPGNGSQPGPTQATIPVLVSLADPASVTNLDQAPVTVNITSQAVKNVLAVPVTALVALAGGGYGVYTITGETRTLVAVTPGLFATTLVQVTSAALHAGDTDEVPVG
jgi:peptidoglycan hydrolase-like protein with peptidoglycan-binding domain